MGKTMVAEQDHPTVHIELGTKLVPRFDTTATTSNATPALEKTG